MNNNLSDHILLNTGRQLEYFTANQLFAYSVSQLSICSGISRAEASKIGWSYIKDRNSFSLNKQEVLRLFKDVTTISQYEYELSQIPIKSIISKIQYCNNRHKILGKHEGIKRWFSYKLNQQT